MEVTIFSSLLPVLWIYYDYRYKRHACMHTYIHTSIYIDVHGNDTSQHPFPDLFLGPPPPTVTENRSSVTRKYVGIIVTPSPSKTYY